jgi:hypothetical protein
MFTPLDIRPARRGRTPAASSVNIAKVTNGNLKDSHTTQGGCYPNADPYQSRRILVAPRRMCHSSLLSTNERRRSNLASHCADISARYVRAAAIRRVSTRHTRSRPFRALRTRPDCSSKRKCLLTPWRETLVCSFNVIVRKGPSLHKRATIVNRTGSPRAAKIGTALVNCMACNVSSYDTRPRRRRYLSISLV